MRSAALAVSCVLVMSASVASSSTRRLEISGTYTSNWDDVTLTQKGDRVTGTYVCCGGGTINGRIIEGRVIKFHWHEPHGAGHGEGVWTITPAGTLDGTWGHGQSSTDGGPWTLVPKTQPKQIAQ